MVQDQSVIYRLISVLLGKIKGHNDTVMISIHGHTWKSGTVKIDMTSQVDFE